MPKLVQLWEGYELYPKSYHFFMETKALAESFDANIDYFMHQEKRLAETKLEYGLIKVTSLLNLPPFRAKQRFVPWAIQFQQNSNHYTRYKGSFSDMELITTYLRNLVSYENPKNLATKHIGK